MLSKGMWITASHRGLCRVQTCPVSQILQSGFTAMHFQTVSPVATVSSEGSADKHGTYSDKQHSRDSGMCANMETDYPILPL